MARDRAPTAEELEAMVRHIAFDIEVLRATGDHVTNTAHDEQERLRTDVGWIALVETCMLHERNVVGFLFAPPPRAWRNGDVLALDYFDEPTRWIAAGGDPERAAQRIGLPPKELKHRLGQRLAHVHLERLQVADSSLVQPSRPPTQRQPGHNVQRPRPRITAPRAGLSPGVRHG